MSTYLELDLEITEEQEALKEQVHKFAREVLRPAALELDKIADPEEVIKKGSLFWEVFRKGYELGYHTIFIPDIWGGLGLMPL